MEVVFDAALGDEAVRGVHPVENTATVFVAFADLEAFIRAHGNAVVFPRL